MNVETITLISAFVTVVGRRLPGVEGNGNNPC